MGINAAPFSDANAHRAPQLPIAYYASKRKALLVLLGCLVFVALSCWMLAYPSVNDPSPQKTGIVGYIGIIFFGSGVVLSLYLLIRKSRIVTLNEMGILIRGYEQWIAWTEITHINLVYQHVPGFFGASPREIKWIGVFLKDTGAYYASLGWIRRILTMITERKLGTPVLINCSLLPIEPDILIAWLNEYRAEQTILR